MLILLTMQIAMSWVNIIVGLLPIIITIVASHIRLSNRITKIESDISSYEMRVDKLEVSSEKHYVDLSKHIEDMKNSIQSLEKAILETSIRRQTEYESVKELIRAMSETYRNHEKRIMNLETMTYEQNINTSRSSRRKNNSD